MSELAKSISKLICLITVKTGEDGKMFGTVTSGMIADQLKTQFEISLDKKKIHLEQPIRALGEHEIQLRLHPDVATSLKVRVESSTPLPEPVAAPAVSEARKEEPKTEKRGRRPERPGGDKTVQPPAGERKPRPPRGERPYRPERAQRPQKPQKSDKAPKPEKPA
jgi:large subunit ribosomal protein L9